ncbi:MAG TPA: glycosyltransferase, partial [Thermoplasmata archaeon]|nr:glycosyltransferase [Thermoplasmata archaeon]
ASAWALAAALSARGDDVRVLHLLGSVSGPVPPGIVGVPVEIPLRRPGGPGELAEFANAAGHQLRKNADLILRDPVGLGALGMRRSRTGPPIVGAFARSVEILSFDGDRQDRPAAGLVDRIDTWLDRRSVRRLERSAVAEADRLFYDGREVAEAFAKEYAIPDRKLSMVPMAVPTLPPLPERSASRQDLRIPPDVPVVVAPTAFEEPDPSGVDRVLEAFRRVRPFFPGVRLVVAGTAAPSDPGVVSLPDRSATSLANALAGADVAVFARRARGFDLGVVLAARAHLPPIVLPNALLPVDPAGGVRVAASDDPGDLASVLAELLADPSTQKDVGRKASKFAESFLPERVAAEVEDALGSRTG